MLLENSDKTQTNNTHLPTIPFLDRPVFSGIPSITIEKLIIGIIILLAIVSRFYQVGQRVMAHDEVNHVVPAYDLYMGRGYAHDPITHGPLQFHLLAASYFILGDTDFAARVPAAIFSVAAVVFVLFAFPRYLGRVNTLVAGFLFTISPFLLFYGRYTRNEAFIELFAVMTLFAVLRFLEKKDLTSMLLLTVSLSLHFAAKETAYIYTAELLIFLAILLFTRLVNNPSWKSQEHRRNFIIFSVVAILLFTVVFGLAVTHASAAEANETGTAIQITEENQRYQTLLTIFGAAFLVSAVGDIIYLIATLGWAGIRKEPSFDLLMMVGTAVLPLLIALPIRMLGWDPLDYTQTGMLRTGGVLFITTAAAAALGLWWNKKWWLLNMGVFYAIFLVFFTTFFTNGKGFFTGLVGALGYWLVQQTVERGTQPLYYYALIQMPMYEYLAIAGLLLAGYFGIKYRKFAHTPGTSPSTEIADEKTQQPANEPVPTLAFFLFWALISLLVFSIAGERMPWLTVHIAIPFLLSAAWGIGFLLEKVQWKSLYGHKALIALLLIPIFITSLLSLIGSILGNNPPFAGKELLQLQATNTFLLAILGCGLSGFVIFKNLKTFAPSQISKLFAVSFFAVLSLLTARAAYMASFINNELAKEFLVYAHASPAPKEILAQVESLSYRLTGGKNLDISYDNDSLYPYWWYFRDYTNINYFGEEPTRDITNSIVILASNPKVSKIDSIVKNNYVKFDYIRLWWPIQDYFGLTPARVWEVIKNPDLRTAIFQIWLNRDYTLYGQVKNTQSVNLETWSPADHFTMYVRKDVVAQMWEYGAAPNFEVTLEEDPYIKASIVLQPDRVIGYQGSEPGALNAPRGLAVAADGSVYVADANNHRIQHFSAQGELINQWGSFADASNAEAPGGSFYEPWDVAVGSDGSIFVADTWNHRIQKFTGEGKFVTMWGYFGTGESIDAMWGPRSIAIDAQGNIYVTDTGNKRVVIFTEDGDPVGKFGSIGFDPGKFDEPVGLAFAPDGGLFVADTWNRRIQGFTKDEITNSYLPQVAWDIAGWFSQSLDNKPFLDIDTEGNLYTTDPEGYRILQFDLAGNFIRSWGDYSIDTDGFGLPAGIAADNEGGVWVSDAGNHRLLHFTLP